MSDTPIADHALLSDCHSAGLVDREGSLVWWCVPRFDSPSVFGQLLDRRAGHFSVRPIEIRKLERRYVQGTLTLESRFHNDEGELVLVEALAMADGVRGHDLGQGSPHRLPRHARCLSGRVQLEIEFVPRFECGLTTPVVSHVDGGVLAVGGPVTLVLSTTADLDVSDGRDRAYGIISLAEGDQIALAVEYGSSWEPPPPILGADEICGMLDDTSQAWRS